MNAKSLPERLFFISCYEVIAVFAAVCQRLLSVQYAVLKRNHHFVKLAEQRHQFGNVEFFRIGADRTAGDAVIAGTIIRLPDEIHLKGGRVLLLLLRCVPFGVLDNTLFVLRLTLVGVQVGLCKIPLDMTKPFFQVYRMKIIFQTSKPSIAIIENCKSKHKLFFEKNFFQISCIFHAGVL